MSNSFTYFADPQKIKRYLGAGNIVLTTNETEIAEKLRNQHLGLVFESNATAKEWAVEIEELINDRYVREQMRFASLQLSRSLSNDFLFQEVTNQLLRKINC
jgi:hypothetical protein